jgi:hypothetical protein
MTRTLHESRPIIARHVQRALAYLGFERDDVELIYEPPAYGAAVGVMHWSAQTNAGDMTGSFPVAHFAPVDCVEIRRAVSDAALLRAQ